MFRRIAYCLSVLLLGEWLHAQAEPPLDIEIFIPPDGTRGGVSPPDENFGGDPFDDHIRDAADLLRCLSTNPVTTSFPPFGERAALIGKTYAEAIIGSLKGGWLWMYSPPPPAPGNLDVMDIPDGRAIMATPIDCPYNDDWDPDRDNHIMIDSQYARAEGYDYPRGAHQDAQDIMLAVLLAHEEMHSKTESGKGSDTKERNSAHSAIEYSSEDLLRSLLKKKQDEGKCLPGSQCAKDLGDETRNIRLKARAFAAAAKC